MKRAVLNSRSLRLWPHLVANPERQRPRLNAKRERIGFAEPFQRGFARERSRGFRRLQWRRLPPVAVRAHAVAGSVAQSLERARLFFALDEGPLCGPPLDAANEVSHGVPIGPRQIEQRPDGIVLAGELRILDPLHATD